jgi:hypothetical protein
MTKSEAQSSVIESFVIPSSFGFRHWSFCDRSHRASGIRFTRNSVASTGLRRRVLLFTMLFVLSPSKTRQKIKQEMAEIAEKPSQGRHPLARRRHALRWRRRAHLGNSSIHFCTRSTM